VFLKIFFGILIITSYCFAEIINIPDDFETILAGIDASEDGDTILVAPGEYIENIDFLGKSITLASHFLTTGNEEFIEETIIDGDQADCVVRIESEQNIQPVLKGFTVRNGLGGVVSYPEPGNLTVLISNNIIERNLPGGMMLEAGGIYITGCSALIRNNIIRFNESSDHGGGIHALFSDRVFIEGNEIYGNEGVGRGGGIYIREIENAVIRNNIIYNNTGSMGGGISIYESYPLIANNTICFNSTHEWDREAGGGIYSETSDVVVIVNNIIYGNESAHGAQIFARENGIIARFCDIQEDIDGEGNLNTDPLFNDSENGDYSLSENSPCIDAGTAFFIWEQDTLIDISRDDYVGQAPDMGALEFNPADVRVSDGTGPSLFVLHPAYPNPFNSATTITYSLPTEASVTLQIYNMRGQSVDVLVDRVMLAGRHSVEWVGSGMSAGVYLVTIKDEGGRIKETQEITILK